MGSFLYATDRTNCRTNCQRCFKIDPHEQEARSGYGQPLMTRLVFHIGQHKTGTTALQRHLASNRRRLRRMGVLYPRLPGWRYAHHALFPYLFDVEHCDPYVLRRLGSSARQALSVSRAAWDEICARVVRLEPAVVILSSETFFRAANFAQMARLGRVLREIADEIEVICYVRNPAELLLSVFSTQIQIDAQFQWPPPGLRKDVLQAYEHVRADKLHVLKFSREALEGGDITQDFCTRFLGGKPGIASSNRVNTSLSVEAMIVMERYVARQNASRNESMPLRQQIFRRLLKRADRLVGEAERARLLPSAEASILNECTDLEWLERNYNIKWSGVSGNLHGEPGESVQGSNVSIRQICHFNADRLRKLDRIMSWLSA